jgi:predicted dienelactone hydrolase
VASGPFGVGVQTAMVPGEGRDVLATTWYPSDVTGGTAALSDLVAPRDAATLAGLMAAAPADCARAQTEATVDAPVAAGQFPVVMFSHCLSCIGASSSFIAERLASHGMVVVGITHTDDTLFDQQQGTVAPLSGEWLAVRTQDIRLAFDEVTTNGPLAAAMDPSRAGVFGHSYGATTTGKVLQDDDRFLAGVAMAAPVENPLLPGVSTAAIAQPMLFILALEDNSIQAIGNTFIRNNAAAMPGGSWLVELADAGHWSVSDLCGVIDEFSPGCGRGTRQTNGEPFSYLPADTGRQIGASYVTAFFALHLLGDDGAAEFLATAEPADVVTVTRFE